MYLEIKYPALLLATFLSSPSFVNFGVIYSETVIKLDQKIKGLKKVYPWVYFYILLKCGYYPQSAVLSKFRTAKSILRKWL